MCHREYQKGTYTPKVYKGTCKSCGTSFTTKCSRKEYCTTACSRRKYAIDNPKSACLRGLLNKVRVDSGLSVKILEQLLDEQQGLCALTGIPLTWTQGEGTVPTNISIDRLVAGGSYTVDNIQLVCKAVNSFRNNLGLEEFKWWCEQVASHNK